MSDVKQGRAGEPGELHGEFNLTEDLGSCMPTPTGGSSGVWTGSS